jgi:hypothetical protein
LDGRNELRMAAVRTIGAGLEQTARETARVDVKIAVRNIVIVYEVKVARGEDGAASVIDVDLHLRSRKYGCT